MSTSSIPVTESISGCDSPSSTGSQSPPLQKKLLLFKHPRHPRYDAVDAAQHVYDYSRYVTPISALTPSKIMPDSRRVRRQRSLVTVPAAVIKYYEKFEPFLFPVLFPLGLASATLQSLPMVLSVLPLAFLFGLAGVLVIPLICLGGVTASSYVLARAAIKLLSRRAGVRLDATGILLLAKEWNSAAVRNGIKGGQAVKSAVEAVMMGTVTLGALASLQPQPVRATYDNAEETKPTSQPSAGTAEVQDLDQQTVEEPRGSRLRPKSNARVNFVDDLPNGLPTSAVPLPSVSSSSPSKATTKAQSIFQSLLLAPNNQSLAYSTIDEIGSEFTSSREPLAAAPHAVSTRPASSGTNQVTPPSPQSPVHRLARRNLDKPLASPQSPALSPLHSESSPYFALPHQEGLSPLDDPEGLTTPTSVSTPGYTPMTPMTPMTPHLSSQQLPSSPNLARTFSNIETKPTKSVSFALHPETSMTSLEAALTKLNSQQIQADEILELQRGSA